VENAAFLGCAISDTAAGDLRQRGALVFAPVTHLPFDPYRATLYTSAELYAGIDEKPYEETPDALDCAWAKTGPGPECVAGTVPRRFPG